MIRSLFIICLLIFGSGVLLMGCKDDEIVDPPEIWSGGFLSSEKYLVRRLNYLGNELTENNLTAALNNDLANLLNSDFLVSNDTLVRVDAKNSPFYEQSAIYRQAEYCYHLKSQSDLHDHNYSYYDLKGDTIYYLGEWTANGISERWHYQFPQARVIYWPSISSGTDFIDRDSSVYLDVSGSGWHYVSSEVNYQVFESSTKFNVMGIEFPGGSRIEMSISEMDVNEVFGQQTRERSEWYWYDDTGKGPYLKAEFGQQGRLLFLTFYKPFVD